MFTIKAYSYQGDLEIYEATHMRMLRDKTQLSFTQPGTPDLYTILMLNDPSVDPINAFSSIYIENMAGKTIEAMKGN